MYWFTTMMLLFIITIIIQGSNADRLCASLNQSHITIDKDISVQAGSWESSGEQLCPANACYSLWTEKITTDNTTVITMLAQGCWESSGKEDCGGEDCVATLKQNKALNNTKFCCCMHDLCNQNMSEPAQSDYEDGVAAAPTAHQRGGNLSDRQMAVVVAACSLTLLAVLVALYAASRRWQDPDKGHSDAVHLMEGARHSNYVHILDHIKLSAVVGQGKYGTVWTGMLDTQQVAVKVFPASHKQYFYNERDIYCLPFMEHPSLLTYFGCSERLNGDLQYLLVLSYCPNGCLQDYLRSHCVDGPTFCLMALSIARGLAFLHTQITKGDKSKWCVCHRDLNTRNILVKTDLSCTLCDLGLALRLSGSHYYCLGEEQRAETKSISDVGTLRYMAPEVLEGAVNLRDCESSLKQIDVYALGLVMWELASRCSDLFSSPPLPYRMPFEAEIGHHPTFEQMQVLVTRKKARPLFAAGWLDSAAARLVRETVDDCWDQDAEARLTALCVQERLTELSSINFRGSNQMGVSPTTINITHTFSLLPSHNNNNNIIMSESTEDTGDKEGVESTVSEGTVETLLGFSPSEPSTQTVPVPNCKNRNNTALQPYQGRNPCFERNLMWDAGNESGLVDRSCKHRGLPAAAEADGSGVVPRVNAPIPFLQNAMAVPKQPNVPPSGTKLAEIISKPLKKFLELKKNRSDRSSKYVPPPRDTRVSLAETKTFTAVLANGADRKKDNNKANDMKVIISPFEEISSGASSRKSAERPSSLPLVNCKNNNVEKKSNIEDIFTNGSKGKLKDLAGRIKTPGDVPPSVRRKRGKRVLGETRFSLYDDRMMEGINLNETEMESNVSTRSFPSGIEFSGKQVKSDSNF